ncbi:MAG TPA: lipoyl(octanoyl) transferase LipB [bacterium]|nr:lipoyl(octanoyl) transferase LipB [bacterium]HPO08697.1 lipoyl(octanoyl) transferase LipB [bacterium]HQO34660.1 lipoyl(octanoyl) transferase LipB [bacterium]HQP99803.1 lipoyl(octanoyl) transferase LipB [bacterium]
MNHVSLFHVHLGLVPYREALRIQEQICGIQEQNGCPDMLLTLEHPAVITIGTSGGVGDLRTDETELRLKNIPVVYVKRGGKATYHGPGQFIAYPLIGLRNLSCSPRRYVEILERTIIRVLKLWGLSGSTIPGHPGVWIENRKIASIGIRLRRGRTMHGVSVNLHPDLDAFSYLVPCGMPDGIVTSIRRELGDSPDIEQFCHPFADVLAQELPMSLFSMDTAKWRNTLQQYHFPGLGSTTD